MPRRDDRPTPASQDDAISPWQSPPLSALSFVRVSQPDEWAGAHVATVDSANAESIEGLLHPDEAALASHMPEARRASFVAGRVALRAAIERADQVAASTPLLRDHRGAPLMPAGIVGSLSHKRSVAVAVAASSHAHNGQRSTVGIDIEERHRTGHVRRDISKRILFDAEFDLLPSGAEDRSDAVLLAFALKEAIYKAIDPFVHRYVRFSEVALVADDVLVGERGRVGVNLLLPEFAVTRPQVRASWWRDDVHVVAMAVIGDAGV